MGTEYAKYTAHLARTLRELADQVEQEPPQVVRTDVAGRVVDVTRAGDDRKSYMTQGFRSALVEIRWEA